MSGGIGETDCLRRWLGNSTREAGNASAVADSSTEDDDFVRFRREQN